MRAKSAGLVEVDDNGYVMGCSEKRAYCRIHVSKSATGHDLGLHMQTVFEKAEIRYANRQQNSMLLSLCHDTGTETIGIDRVKCLVDPRWDITFWSDPLIHLDGNVLSGSSIIQSKNKRKY